MGDAGDSKSVWLEFHGVKVTSAIGQLALRKPVEMLGLRKATERILSGLRMDRNTRHDLTVLLP